MNEKSNALRRIREVIAEARARFEEEILESGEFDYDEITSMSEEALLEEFTAFIENEKKMKRK